LHSNTWLITWGKAPNEAPYSILLIASRIREEKQ